MNRTEEHNRHTEDGYLFMTEDTGTAVLEWYATIDDSPVRGNALASGCNVTDRAAEDAILMRLSEDDVWAWAHVVCVAKAGGCRGVDSLGQCTYMSAQDFLDDDCAEDMRQEAIRDLKEDLSDASKALRDMKAAGL